MSRRRLYIPITRSGSSILASIFTQMLDHSRGGQFSYVLMWWGIFFVFLLFMMIAGIAGKIFG